MDFRTSKLVCSTYGFSSNALGLCNKFQAGNVDMVDVTLHLDSPGSSCLHGYIPSRVKRISTYEDIRIEGPEQPLLALGLANLSSSSQNKRMSLFSVSNAHSVTETDEFPANLDLNFDLGKESICFLKTFGIDPASSRSKISLDLQLRLPTAQSEDAMIGVMPLSGQEESRPAASVSICMSNHDTEGSSASCLRCGSNIAFFGNSYANLSSNKKVSTENYAVELTSDDAGGVGAAGSCSHNGCTSAARGKSGLCIRHGGGSRCQMENCNNGAYSSSGFCISHGGGNRCHFPTCQRGAQGRTSLCKAHGGGKRCTFLGCLKSAEGSALFCKRHGGGKRCSFQGGGVCLKSVHSGTQSCIAHGGGKRCAVLGCSSSARGPTLLCVRHGGGKRCKTEGCKNGAQGSSDYCKAHGGGKRCSWGQVGSQFGTEEPQCSKSARAKFGLCTVHSGLVQDHRVHGGREFGPFEADHANSLEPIVMDEDSENVHVLAEVENGGPNIFGQSSNTKMPSVTPNVSMSEGRVRQGSLMALLAKSSGVSNALDIPAYAGASDHDASLGIVYKYI